MLTSMMGKLSAKTMITIVPMSNQLIGTAGYNVEQLVLVTCCQPWLFVRTRHSCAMMALITPPTGFKAIATAASRTKPERDRDPGSDRRFLDSLILMLMASGLADD